MKLVSEILIRYGSCVLFVQGSISGVVLCSVGFGEIAIILPGRLCYLGHSPVTLSANTIFCVGDRKKGGQSMDQLKRDVGRERPNDEHPCSRLRI